MVSFRPLAGVVPLSIFFGGAYKWGFYNYNYLPTGMILQVAPCFFSNRRNSKALKVFDREDVKKGAVLPYAVHRALFGMLVRKRVPFHTLNWNLQLYLTSNNVVVSRICWIFVTFTLKSWGMIQCDHHICQFSGLFANLLHWLLVMPEICRKFHEGISNDQSDNVTLTSDIMCFPPWVKHYIELDMSTFGSLLLICVHLFSLSGGSSSSVFPIWIHPNTWKDIPWRLSFLCRNGVNSYSYSFREICSSRNSAMSLLFQIRSKFGWFIHEFSTIFPVISCDFPKVIWETFRFPSSPSHPLRKPIIFAKLETLCSTDRLCLNSRVVYSLFGVWPFVVHHAVGANCHVEICFWLKIKFRMAVI